MVKEAFKSSSKWMVGTIIFMLLCAIPILLLHGVAWVSEKFLPILNLVSVISFAAILVFGTPLIFFRATRHVTGICFVYWSQLNGALLWMFSLLVTLQIWGMMAAIVGVILMGVGIFPVAVLACAFNGYWKMVGELFLNLAFVLLARFGGFFLMYKSNKYGDD
jgi:hypothetical protein